MKVKIKASEISYGFRFGGMLARNIEHKYISNWFSDDEVEVDLKDLNKVRQIKDTMRSSSF
jgi:uncharacterized protein YacL (UPF0231 family)